MYCNQFFNQRSLAERYSAYKLHGRSTLQEKPALCILSTDLKQKQGDQYGSSELIGLCEPELKTQNMSYYKHTVYM